MALVSLTRTSRQPIVMDFHGASTPQRSHSVLAAAAVFPQGYSVVQQAVEPAQSDKPIGYGAFGVVW